MHNKQRINNKLLQIRRYKRNPNIKSLNICNIDFLYTAYADDITFFLQNEKSATEDSNNFNFMSQFFGLKIDKSK